MELTLISEPGADERDLTPLFRWFMRSPDVVRHCRVELCGDGEGTMGATDVLNIIVPNAIAAANLALAYATFRRANPSASGVTVQAMEAPAVMLPAEPHAATVTLTLILQEPPTDPSVKAEV